MAELPKDGTDRISFETYQNLRDFEGRFNVAQAETKKLASVWMLATFAALGFIVRGELTPDKTLVDSAPLLAAVALGGNVGLLSLWVIDQRVYQQLLNAAFDIGLELERRNPAWAPIRSVMWAKSGARGMARFHAVFYAAPMLLTSAAAAYAVFAMQGGDNVLVVAAGVVTFLLLLIVIGDWGGRKRGLEHENREKSDSILEVARRWTE